MKTNGQDRVVSPAYWPESAIRRLLAVITELGAIINDAERSKAATEELMPYTRWSEFRDDELDILSHCIRLPHTDDEWHEAWLMLGQINVEVERRQLPAGRPYPRLE